MLLKRLYFFLSSDCLIKRAYPLQSYYIFLKYASNRLFFYITLIKLRLFGENINYFEIFKYSSTSTRIPSDAPLRICMAFLGNTAFTSLGSMRYTGVPAGA